MVPPQTSTPNELGPEAYRAMYDFSPDGVMFTAPDGRILAANPAACEILRRSEAEIRGLGRQGMADPTDSRWGPLLEERERTGAACGVARMLRGDGVAIEVEMSARIFTDAAGEPRSCTVIRDVTERTEMERTVAESRAMLAEAERVAGMGSWEWDLVQDRTTWSDGLLALYGLSTDQFDPTLEGGVRRVYPEDRARVRNTIENAISQRSSFTLEYRAMRSDGRVRTFRSQGDVVVDESGTPVRLLGVVQDITDAGAAAEPGSETPVALTPRQLEIVQLIGQGLTNVAIAERLYLTEGTVKWHVKQILAKTGAANRAEALGRVLGTQRHAPARLNAGWPR